MGVGSGDGRGKGRFGRFVFGAEEAIHSEWFGERLSASQGTGDADLSVEVVNPEVWAFRVSAGGDGIDAKPAPLGCLDPLGYRSACSGDFLARLSSRY